MPTALSPFAAPSVSFAGAAILAALPQAARPAARAAGCATGAASLVLACLAAPAPGFRVDAASLLFGVLAASVGLLAATVLAPEDARGSRLRASRALPALMTGLAVLAAELRDPGRAILAAAACTLAGAAALAIARGVDAAVASSRQLRVTCAGAGLCFLGIALASLRPALGACATMLGAAALGAAAPFSLAWPRAAFRLPVGLAIAVLLLPPLASLAVLLRARLLLAGTAPGAASDIALMVAGLIGMAGAAVAAGRARHHAEAASWVAPGLLGTAVFGAGIGGAAGLQAGLVALIMAVMTASARLLSPAGALGRASALAAAFCPPFGMFAAACLLLAAAMPVRPFFGCLFVLAALGLAFAAGKASQPVPPETSLEASLGASGAGRALRALLLAALVVLGIAMPTRLSDGIVDAAEILAGDAG